MTATLTPTQIRALVWLTLAVLAWWLLDLLARDLPKE